MTRAFVRIDLTYRLRRPGGYQTPDTQAKVWFFDVPAARDTGECWTELLHRIFFDSNVALRRQEPGDDAWLHLDGFRASPVDVAAVLAWDGTSEQPFPWIAAARAVVWEPGPCYFVDAAGRYDVMSGHDFSELVVMRELQAGRLTEAVVVDYFDRYFPKAKPGVGRRIFDDRERRFANLTEIRTATAFRREPGTQPWTSGPVDGAA